ncbi:dhps, partial [Symbiodinium sp. KB8]
VDVIVTTGGGIEEDFMKCFRPHYLGDFELKGSELRMRGINRIGNLLVPNNNYCKFEDWFSPLLHEMHDEQEKYGTVWTPAKMIARMGEAINHEDSVYYWAWKNNIPVYCPAITDGSIGDMMFFHSYKRPGFVCDINQDIRGINEMAMKAPKTGMIIIGGGLVKHHTCNANLMRNGADFSVFINTGQEFDGSDSGARPDEAISWGKIRLTAKPVKIYSEATLVFPLMVAQTFYKNFVPREDVGCGKTTRPTAAVEDTAEAKEEAKEEAQEDASPQVKATPVQKALQQAMAEGIVSAKGDALVVNPSALNKGAVLRTLATVARVVLKVRPHGMKASQPSCYPPTPGAFSATWPAATSCAGHPCYEGLCCCIGCLAVILWGF